MYTQCMIDCTCWGWYTWVCGIPGSFSAAGMFVSWGWGRNSETPKDSFQVWFLWTGRILKTFCCTEDTVSVLSQWVVWEKVCKLEVKQTAPEDIWKIGSDRVVLQVSVIKCRYSNQLWSKCCSWGWFLCAFWERVGNSFLLTKMLSWRSFQCNWKRG